MSKLTIKHASANDLGSLQDLNMELGAYNASVDKFAKSDWSKTQEGITHFRKSIEDDDRAALLAELDGIPVGFITAKMITGTEARPGRTASLEIMVVKDGKRGEGIGAKLVEEFFNWAKSQKAERAVVNAYAANERAQHFYKKFGFKPLDINFEKVLD